MARPLGVAAAVAAVACVGCMLAAALAVSRNFLLRFSATFPAEARRVQIAVGIAVLIGLGMLGMWWSVSGVISGEAPLLSRRAGTVGAAVDPAYFWASVVFHFLLGLFLFCGGLYIAYRRSKGAV